MGSAIHNLNDDLERLASLALEDERFEDTTAINPEAVAVSVSLLFNPLALGEMPADKVERYYRHGQQTVMAYRDDHLGLLLPFVAATDNLDSLNFAQAVLDKAGLTEPPYYWGRFDCATWLAEAEGVWPIVGGFPSIDNQPGDLNKMVTHHRNLHIKYLLKHLTEDGTFYSHYQPFQNRLFEDVDLARLAFGAWVLSRADQCTELKVPTDKIVDYLLREVVETGERSWLSGHDENP